MMMLLRVQMIKLLADTLGLGLGVFDGNDVVPEMGNLVGALAGEAVEAMGGFAGCLVSDLIVIGGMVDVDGLVRLR